MKKFVAALTILLAVTAANLSEAAPFTESQFGRIFTDVAQNPAAAPENSKTLDVNVDTFKEKFDTAAKLILKQVLGTDDISDMEYLFTINDYKIFPNAGGDTFAKIFGSNVAVVGVTLPKGGNFKILQCCYTAPEDKNETLYVQLILTAFVHSVAPEVEVPTLMNELTAENSSGTVTRGDLKFSIAEDGNLDTLTVVKL